MLSNVLTVLLLAASTLAVPLDTVHKRAGCADVVVHYARGTFEPAPIGGEIGATFQSSLVQALGSKTLIFQGVDYPANVGGYLGGGDAAGSTTLANSVIATARDCPNAKIVMSGYSQGAQLVHNAAKKLSDSVIQRVNAVVTFGDPNKSKSLPAVLEARRKTFCNSGDLICAGTVIITGPHTDYAKDGPAAADFVKARV